MANLADVGVEAKGIRLGASCRDWAELGSVTLTNLLLVGSITLQFGEERVKAWGSVAAARSLHAQIQEGLATWAESGRTQVRGALGVIREFMGRDCYLTRQLVEAFLEANVSTLRAALGPAKVLAAKGDAHATEFTELIKHFEATVDRRNTTWSAEEQERWRDLFDSVEKSPLTPEQRKAVVDFENRNLLIAAAGSGKSSTLLAKVAYAVRKGLFKPDEILALAFNKKAAEELTTRIRVRLKEFKGVEQIRSETFHGLGSRILAAKGKQTIEGDREGRIQELYDRLKETDNAFRREAVLFVLNFTPDLRDRTKFATFEEYQRYLRTAEARGGKNGRRVPTLSGHHVASLEEMKIANWLFTHSVPFEYEKSYPHGGTPRDRRGYTPDFYYPVVDAWHEHFAVDANGRPAPCIGDAQQYRDGVEWKRECHAAHGTKLVETTSALFADGTIFAHLEQRLRALGHPLRELTPSEIDAKLAKNEHRDFVWLITTFISHWKVQQVPFETLMARGDARDHAFLAICKRVYDEYATQLKNERRVDFDDLILGATRAVKSGDWRSPFKLILVDEFQDISAARAELLRALLAQHRDAVLFCVGDDWQAINGFAGADLRIMRNFRSEFGFHSLNYLTQTFRSNQGISTAAKAFVERNPAQFKKEVVAHDKTKEDCLRILRYANGQHAQAYAEIARELSQVGECSLRVLGRYNRNLEGVDLDAFKAIAPAVQVEFSTMHKSKGLEADYIILDSLEGRGRLAFPSTFADDSVLRLVMPEKEAYPNAEERRLMYVALTRARRRVYILASDDRPSSFARELESNLATVESVPVYACPHCKNGKRVQRTGKYGPFWSCSRFPDCDGKARK